MRSLPDEFYDDELGVEEGVFDDGDGPKSVLGDGVISAIGRTAASLRSSNDIEEVIV